MFLRFSEDAQKLFLLSLKEKNKLNDSFIGSEHIFLGLLSMNNNYICKILNDAGVFYDKFLSFFEKKKDGDNSNYFIFTPLMKDILSSLSTVKKNEVGVVDVVLEILCSSNSKVNLALRKMNINIKDIMKSINSNNKKKKGFNRGILNEIGINLNEKCSNDNEVILGRDKELNMIIEILCCKNKNNPILIGEAGVGKTAIVEELARRVARGDVPYKLKNKKIYSVAMSSLVAGTKYRGEFEEKINKLILEVENNDDVILFIDEVHTLVGAGGADGAIDASNILKPSLARGNIKIIGATTNDEYKKYFANDKALSRRFKTVYIKEPNSEETKDILKGIKNIYEEYHNVVIPNAIIDRIVYYADKYIQNRKFPDKAIDILDEVCVLSSFVFDKSYEIINSLDKEVNEIINLKNKALIIGDYKTAMKCSCDEKKLQSKISKVQLDYYQSNRKNIVLEKTLLQVMERKTNIPFYSYKYEYNKFMIPFKKYKSNSIFMDNINNKINTFTLNFFSNIINHCFNNSLYIETSDNNKNNYFIDEYLNSFFKEVNVINIDINNFRNVDDLLGNDNYCNEKDNFINMIKNNYLSVVVISNYDNSDLSIKEFFNNINSYGYYINKNNEKIDFSNVLFIYNILNNNKTIGFNDKEVKIDNNCYINIDSLSRNKLKKRINKLIGTECLSNKNLNIIINRILSNSSYLNNLDFFIKKELVNKELNLNKNRTIRV